jgi:DNA-binding GntR family transcriptional regulator
MIFFYLYESQRSEETLEENGIACMSALSEEYHQTLLESLGEKLFLWTIRLNNIRYNIKLEVTDLNSNVFLYILLNKRL